jgi:hypothetical protein
MDPQKPKTATRQPWSSPGTDPTNPCSQEAAGEFKANEEANERRLVEPGLTDRDREARGPDKGDRA